jgi:hypothetical protein
MLFGDGAERAVQPIEGGVGVRTKFSFGKAHAAYYVKGKCSLFNVQLSSSDPPSARLYQKKPREAHHKRTTTIEQ